MGDLSSTSFWCPAVGAEFPRNFLDHDVTPHDAKKVLGSHPGFLSVRDWGDSMDVNVGWCNYKTPAVIEYWTNEWKQ